MMRFLFPHSVVALRRLFHNGMMTGQGGLAIGGSILRVAQRRFAISLVGSLSTWRQVVALWTVRSVGRPLLSSIASRDGGTRH